MVDLTVCKPGDYLISRNGDLFVYEERSVSHIAMYPHSISNLKRGYTHTVTDDGQLYREGTSDYDVIEIVPQTNSNTPYFELYEKLRLHKRASSVA